MTCNPLKIVPAVWSVFFSFVLMSLASLALNSSAHAGLVPFNAVSALPAAKSAEAPSLALSMSLADSGRVAGAEDAGQNANLAQRLDAVSVEMQNQTVLGMEQMQKTVEGWQQKGVASWYGPGFHGRKTASGERFNTHELTAAHLSLPFGTKLLVRNERNGKEVVVRVNDRGPYIKSRIIDLSQAAARALGIDGVGRVIIQRLENSDSGRPIRRSAD